MAELQFFTGTMDSGKSTMALQLDFTYRRRGLKGKLLTRHDRNGAVISSRIGLQEAAIEVTEDLDLVAMIGADRSLRYLICDEAQFYLPRQIDDLAFLVDEFDLDVFAFGILTDFTGHMFPGAARLMELADRRLELPVPALCWCGRTATHNARVIGGAMAVDGAVVDPDASYHVVCRKHHRQRLALPASAPLAAVN